MKALKRVDERVEKRVARRVDRLEQSKVESWD